MATLIKAAYGPRKRTPLMFKTKGRTKQQFSQDCDINRIVQRAESTDLHKSGFNTEVPMSFGDASGVIEFQDALNIIINAESAFNGLPSRVRRRFDNNPGEYLKFLENPENKDEAISLGMVNKPAEVPPAEVPPAGAPSVPPVGEPPEAVKKPSTDG